MRSCGRRAPAAPAQARGPPDACRRARRLPPPSPGAHHGRRPGACARPEPGRAGLHGTGPDRLWPSATSRICRRGRLALPRRLAGCAPRRVVGWAMADHLRAELALDALAMALKSRRPAPGLIHHTDRGRQYTAATYRAALAAVGATASMSRSGDCLDNAMAESLCHPRPRWPRRAPGRPVPPRDGRSSGSRSGTTASAATPRSTFTRPSPSRRTCCCLVPPPSGNLSVRTG